ncbi:MAG: IS3 family transposase, partial [Erysipelotrichaceae bacterium]|nr:IS3 family transposase [Erysipelotrichaceae bacterium]
LKYPLKILLKISGLKRSTYYYTLSKIDKDMKNDEIMNDIINIFYAHKERYGYRRITLELRNIGYTINHKKVKRLMSIMGLYGKTPKAKYKSYKGDMNGTTKNLLLNKVVDEENHKTYYERSFNTTRCNEIWATDVSEFHISAGKLYLSPILDLHNREIVSFNISASPNFDQTKDMLKQAFDKYDNLRDLIFHSDQGWQYQMQQYHKMLKEKGIKQSMSRKGNCLDNSPMENFFGKMKNEMFYGHEYSFKTLDDLKKAMVEYIDYYNNQRIIVKLKGLTPAQYRNQSLITA